MGWAVAMEGQTDPEAVLLLFHDRLEAESIAAEMRSRGQHVTVRPYPDRPPSRYT